VKLVKPLPARDPLQVLAERAGVEVERDERGHVCVRDFRGTLIWAGPLRYAQAELEGRARARGMLILVDYEYGQGEGVPAGAAGAGSAAPGAAAADGDAALLCDAIHAQQAAISGPPEPPQPLIEAEPSPEPEAPALDAVIQTADCFGGFLVMAPDGSVLFRGGRPACESYLDRLKERIRP
jgi:hypothetical protein